MDPQTYPVPPYELVPCQNSLVAPDLQFFAGYAALRYSEQAAKDLPALGLGCEIDDVAGRTQRGLVLQALVWPVAVIVRRTTSLRPRPPGVLGAARRDQPHRAGLAADRPLGDLHQGDPDVP
jgi:hypothetical protein